jgi:hypothetical protein
MFFSIIAYAFTHALTGTLDAVADITGGRPTGHQDRPERY